MTIPVVDVENPRHSSKSTCPETGFFGTPSCSVHAVSNPLTTYSLVSSFPLFSPAVHSVTSPFSYKATMTSTISLVVFFLVETVTDTCNVDGSVLSNVTCFRTRWKCLRKRFNNCDWSMQAVCTLLCNRSSSAKNKKSAQGFDPVSARKNSKDFCLRKGVKKNYMDKRSGDSLCWLDERGSWVWISGNTMGSSLHNQLWCIDTVLLKGLSIWSLPQRPHALCKGILPSQMIPVIYMVCQSYDRDISCYVFGLALS